VLALDLDGGARFAAEAGERFVVRHDLGQHQLDGDALIQLQVMGGDDDPHATRTEDPLDAVLAREDFPFAHPFDYGWPLLHSRPYAPRCRALPSRSRPAGRKGVKKLAANGLAHPGQSRGMKPPCR
jgi:hypothetical protein